MGSITDPIGARRGNTGNGIAVYKFENGKVTAERFVKIAPQEIAAGKKVAFECARRKRGPRFRILRVGRDCGPRERQDTGRQQSLRQRRSARLPRWAGFAAVRPQRARNDSIFISLHRGCDRDGRRAWCSLWNSSSVAELDLEKGIVTRWISVLEPKDPIAPGSHPTALLLSPDEKWLYVALSNADAIAVVDSASGNVIHLSSTNLSGQEHPGTYPTALALSADGMRLFVADSSLNAVAMFDAAALAKPASLFRYPGSSRIHSYRLVSQRAGGLRRRLARCHGQRRGCGPNSGISQLKK